jgi:class 3 adenylate cyclase
MLGQDAHSNRSGGYGMEQDNRIFGKYICLDIVGYTHERSVEEQLTILGALNEIVRDTLDENKLPLTDDGPVVCLPTGDGMCIALINNSDPEIHLRIALGILQGVARHNNEAEKAEKEKLVFQVRIGINSHTDNLVTDINGRRNVAGVGINTAFRIMDLADGQQILVGQAVHDDQLGRRYEKSFLAHSAVVRHGKELTVHQFRVAGLDEHTPSKIQNYKDFIHPADALGLKTIYETRSSTVREDVLKDMEDAKERIWLLGVNLNHIFSISDPRVQEILKSKLDAGLDVKILLLDGLRSPAVFRALMESDEKEFASIIESDRCDLQNPPDEDPYFHHPLFVNFLNAHRILERLGFKTAARFYAHIPNCWLIVIDDTIYYQPYTFGGAQDVMRMPVIKVQGPEEAPYKVLKDHFDKLWQTSEFDLFQTGARIKAQEIVIGKLFEHRLEWFKHVFGVLYNKESPGRDRRAFQRQPCISPSLVATLTWPDGRKTTGKIINHSRESLLVALHSTDDSKELFGSLPDGDGVIKADPMIVELVLTSSRDQQRGSRFVPKDKARRFLVTRLLEHGTFRYARKERRTIRKHEKLCVAINAYERQPSA